MVRTTLAPIVLVGLLGCVAGAQPDVPPPPPFEGPASEDGGPPPMPPPGFNPGDEPGAPFKRRHARHLPPEARDESLRRFDADGGNRLNADERHAAHEAMRARIDALRAEMIQRFDKDGDGTLSPEERKAGADALLAEGRERDLHLLRIAHEMKIRHERMLAEFDTDHDGVLNDAERQAMKDALRARMEQHRAAMLKEFDVNGDGVLDDAERAAAHAAIKQRMQSARAWHALGVAPGQAIDDDAIRRATDLISAKDPRGDFNGDGTVDQADLAEVMKRAGR